ncbi:hypothetical protein ACHAW5_005077 [Stephanodiscus triporus]|uniref:Condensin complex subunit 2 n=1 Tax=Stephanodiscus triporus TaxID=2934178 RepID=A0ABD3MGD9_9STRA
MEEGTAPDESSSSRKRRKLDSPQAATGTPPTMRSPGPPSPSGEEGEAAAAAAAAAAEEEEVEDLPLRMLIPPSPSTADWSAVIARAISHPHEAAESFFGPPSSAETRTESSTPTPPPRRHPVVARCIKPMHAMLFHDPPVEAVEAVLRAHPEAALDVTFDGTTALRIAAGRSRPRSNVDDAPSLRTLRLLLVAELAMARRGEMEGRRWRKRGRPAGQEENGDGDGDGGVDSDDDIGHGDGIGGDVESDEGLAFFGHNPIGWITEPSIPVKTVAMLLKWYPIGAFQRRRGHRSRPYEDDDEDGDTRGSLTDYLEDDTDSPLIRIVDDFARDNYNPLGGGVADDVANDDDDADGDEIWNLGGSINSDDYSTSGQSAGSATRIASRLYLRRERRRKEERWEKFLHILYATDSTLQSTRKPPQHYDGGTSEEEGNIAKAANQSSLDSTIPAASGADNCTKPSTTSVAGNATTAGPLIAIASVTSTPSLSRSDASTSVRTTENNYTRGSSVTATTATTKQADSVATNATNSEKKTSITPFHPVHAWIRCLTSPNLGLEHCQAYGVWSVLRDMERRIPNEFTVRDGTDGNRTAFQTLAECKAKDCKLCLAEIRDIVECLMDANHRSAFLPRKSDGRLIGHVALENGWPCKDLFSSKTSATCA